MLKELTEILIRYGTLGLFVIGLLDSAGVPLPAAMDLLLLGVAIKTPHNAWLAAIVAIIGSLGGNIILFRAARLGGSRFVKKDVPLEEQHRFRRWFARYGLLTVFIPAVVPIVPLPLKVFVVSAGAMHTPTGRFLAAILAARILRYFGLAFLGIQLGENAEGFLRHNGWGIVGGLVVMAFLIMIVMRWYDRRSLPASNDGRL
jgi:membrane protein DedA with SNARE-associated domain